MDYVYVPREFTKLNKFVTIGAYVIFSNNIPFLITMSCSIDFMTVEHVPTDTVKQLSKH